jgi:signal transduction histidine kinase
MPRDPSNPCPRAVKTTVVLLAYGAVLAMGAAFGGVALIQLRSTTDQLEAVISRSAEIVIEVERLHESSDHLGMAARSYLLTQDAGFLAESRGKAQEFRRRMRDLTGQIEDAEAVRMLARIRELDARGQEEMERLFTARGQMSEQELVAVVEQRGQPLRDQIGDLIEELSSLQEQIFRDATREAQVAVTHASRILGALAVVGLFMAAALTVALVRTLRLVARARVELEASHARLERANHDLDAFGGRIAHDLRNVIAPLGLLADTLGQGAADTRTVQRAAERLQRLTDKADGLIGALLDFARSGGEPPGRPETAPVGDVIRDVVADLAALVTDRRASVQIEADDVQVRCSRSLLQTVLMNLVGNALKYLDGEARVVRVSARLVGNDCEITVSDSGPGIPADALESIFDPFYRVPGTAAPGTGLGLATVHRIVQAHQGQVSVQSRVGQGSRFVVSLPAGEPASHQGT